jgi:hypothetical protein
MYLAKICIKYRKHYISTVWADWADLGSAKTAKQKLKYATFEAIFFMFSWAKNDFKKI